MATASEWRRASGCTANECIEVRRYDDGVIGIRNQKNLHEFVVASPEEFAAFLVACRAGEFDDLA